MPSTNSPSNCAVQELHRGHDPTVGAPCERPSLAAELLGTRDDLTEALDVDAEEDEPLHHRASLAPFVPREIVHWPQHALL